MIIGIVGSRSLGNCYDFICDKIPIRASMIVSGGATGVDTLAKQYAEQYGLSYKEFLPDYKKYGKRATLVRNKEIIQYCDEVYIFWDGKSRGCANVFVTCQKEFVPMKIFTLNPSDFEY